MHFTLFLEYRAKYVNPKAEEKINIKQICCNSQCKLQNGKMKQQNQLLASSTALHQSKKPDYINTTIQQNMP